MKVMYQMYKINLMDKLINHLLQDMVQIMLQIRYLVLQVINFNHKINLNLDHILY